MNDHFHMVRFLSRKHVDPTNLERMTIKLAVDIFDQSWSLLYVRRKTFWKLASKMLSHDVNF